MDQSVISIRLGRYWTHHGNLTCILPEKRHYIHIKSTPELSFFRVRCDKGHHDRDKIILTKSHSIEKVYQISSLKWWIQVQSNKVWRWLSYSVLCREPSCRPQDGWLRSGTGTRKLGRHEPSSANRTAWRPSEDGLHNPSYLFLRILFKVLRLVITTLHSQRTSIQSAIGRPAVILSLVIKSISAMHW